MSDNRLYEVEIFHRRSTPIVHEVRQRGYLAYVDLDHLPRVPVLAEIRSADHFGDPARSIRANVETLLAEHGIELAGGRITMLTQPRSLGYVFNPLTLFWCRYRDGELACVVAEVHNTYGQHHTYVVRPDEGGRADTEKRFYVSPFYPVDGYYRMSVTEPARPTDRLSVTMTLHRPEGSPFVASVRGVPGPFTRRRLLRLLVRYPLYTQRVRAGITRHGVTLLLKGLPVMARPDQTSSLAGRLAALLREFAGVELPVRLRAWDGSEAGPADGPVVVLRSRRALRRVAARPGELGLARAYISGDIDVEGDIDEGFRRVWQAARTQPSANPLRLTPRLRMRAALAAVRLGVVGWPPKPPAIEARIGGRLHSRARDRSVIAHHYDLSNDFYQLILDDTMAYSCGLHESATQPLVDAQRAKLDLICRKLGLVPGQRLLDVGCGWGSLILHAAEHYGVRATGITLSAQQRDFVAKRAAERGLTDLVTVRLQDYRDFQTAVAFDAVSSIEMGEHVGRENYPAYLDVLRRSLAPGGRLLLQQMSRAADAAPGGGEFIEAYIAPDMHMRPLSETVALFEQADFEVVGIEGLRPHYALTARAWLANFEANYPQAVALVGEQVARVWRLYLVGGALSFEEGRMGVDQILATRQ